MADGLSFRGAAFFHKNTVVSVRNDGEVMMQIRKAVFPAAGLGTRFLPATKAQPKEMLTLVDKPLIQYVVEEAVQAGIRNITIITGRGKNAIEDHFDVSYELEQVLSAREKKTCWPRSAGSPTWSM